jgi:hypothetical protein
VKSDDKVDIPFKAASLRFVKGALRNHTPSGQGIDLLKSVTLDWIHLAMERQWWQALTNRILNVLVP